MCAQVLLSEGNLATFPVFGDADTPILKIENYVQWNKRHAKELQSLRKLW